MKKLMLILVSLMLAMFLASCDTLDKTSLQNAVNINIKQEDYTDESFAAYKEKYDAAVAVLEDTATTEDKIAEATRELNAAINALVKRANFGSLETLLQQSYNEEDYVSESYAQYLDAYNTAKAVYENKNSRQSAVNSAVKLLKEKINALIGKPDTTELEKLLLVEIDQSKYTSSSVDAYKMICAAAERLKEEAKTAVSMDEVIDCNTEIQLCMAQLKSAIENLVPKGDKTPLQEKYNEMYAFYTGTVNGVPTSVYYSETTYKALGVALAKAKQALDSDDLDDLQVTKMIADLVAAKDALEESELRRELHDLIVSTQDKYGTHVDYFTEDSFKRLNDAINKAIDEYNSPTSTIGSVKIAMAEIENAVNALEYVIIVGTGKTNFDFSSYVIRVGNAVVGIGDYFANPEEFLALISGSENTAVISVSGTLREGVTVLLEDSTIVEFTRVNIVIKRSSGTTSDMQLSSASFGLVDLMADAEVLINTFRGNPTEYLVEGTTGIFLYQDGENGYSVKAEHNMKDNVIDSIDISYYPTNN